MNSHIINQFKLLLKQIEYDINNTLNKERTKNLFRYKSIQNALNVIKVFPDEIKTFKQLENIKGIGKGTLKRIDEILKKNKLSEIKISKNIKKFLQQMENLQHIFGIGKKKAYELIRKHNIKSIKELKQKVKSKEIKVTKNIKLGLKYYKKIETKVPNNVMKEINELMLTELKYIKNTKGIMCGSYRREKATSGDIDFLITNKNDENLILEKFINKLKKINFIIESFTSSNVPTKYMGLCSYKNMIIHIDIRYIPYKSFYYAILYFTGSKEHNIQMRKIALMLGYTLNEYGLYDERKNMLIAKSEKDIFKYLNLEFVKPNLR